MTVTAPEKPRLAQPPAAAGEPAMAVRGLVDIRGSQAYLRTGGYQPGSGDIRLSAGQLRQFGLRPGDLATGTARPPRPGAARPGQTLASLDTVNGRPAAQAAQRPRFAELTPLYPQQRLRLDTPGAPPAARVIDLVSPLGMGQRGLIVAPPKAGKTMVLKDIATSVAAGNPAAHLMVVLVGERPEEVTDLRRTVRGEVIAATFDQPAADHIAVAELAIERAKRLAELGQDVVVLVDSVTRLARACNLAAPASSRVLTGGLSAAALQPVRQFLGAARNLEDGGSLTIVATALVETGSRMDDLIFEELKGTGNMELRLRRDLAEKRLFPAVDVTASSTRREDLLRPAADAEAAARLRRALAELGPQQALELLLSGIADTPSTRERLQQVQRSPGRAA